MSKEIKYPKGQEDAYKAYLDDIQRKMEDSEREKTRGRIELNGLNIYQYYNENERIANTLSGGKKTIDPKEGKINVKTGAPESKLESVVANLISLNLGTNVEAYDENNIREIELGMAMEDIIEELDERTLDRELQYSRFLELMKQGTAYVEVLWDKDLRKKKILKNKNWKGEFLKYEGHLEKLEVAYEGPRRKLMYGPHVWLGSYTIYDMERQPYIFSMEKISSSECKARFGQFENYKFVKNKASEFNKDNGKSIYENNWTLTDYKEGIFEIIKFQDVYNDHIQIFVNGVPMMPMGFPLSFISPSGYTITKSIFKFFHEKLAIGKSFVSSGDISSLSEILDLLLSMNVFKTLQSIKPARANLSGQHLPPNFLFPGNLVSIDPTSVPVIGDQGQGVTQSEYQIMKEIQDRLDKATVSNSFTGQNDKKGQTATEAEIMAQQARVALGRTVASALIMEQRISQKIISIILYRHFDPIEDKKGRIDIVRKKILGASTTKLYNITTRQKIIDDEGMGERQIIPVSSSEMVRDPKKVRELERKEEKIKGIPIQKIFISSEDVKNWNFIWFVDIVPKEKDSKQARKAKFRETIADMAPLIELGSRPNLEALENQLAHANGKKHEELFLPRQEMQEQGISNAASQALLQGTGGGNQSSVVNDL